MLDPLSALNFACSIAQLVDLARNVISDGRQVAKLGSTSENECIRAIVKDMNKLSAEVVELYRPATALTSSDVPINETNDETSDQESNGIEASKVVANEEALRKLGEASIKVSTDLARMLDDLQIRDTQNSRKRKRDVLSTSFKTMLKKDDIQKLEKRLQSLQQELHLRLTFMMSLRSHESTMRQNVLETLIFAEINDRQDAIPSNYAQTFEWILHDAAVGFADWARFRSGLFWITGKPGSGKSTLMKYLSNHRKTFDLLQSWAGSDKLIIAQHYFWIVGTPTQKSQAGLLRSLLFQILDQSPEIAPLVAPDRFHAKHNVHRPWTMSELVETIKKITELQDLPVRFCLFIDGLDEYDGEHKELIDLLSDVGKSAKVKMAISSRQWNAFVEAYEMLPSENRIIMQDLTREDISAYVEGNLRADKRYQKLHRSSQGEVDLVRDITDRSQGVFLWVFLVVRSLLRGLTNGDDLDVLQQRLDEYPDSLDGYFDRMFKSTESVYKQQMGRLLLAAIHCEGVLFLRTLDDFQTELKDSDYDLWLPREQILRTSNEEKQEVSRVRRLLDARCRDLLEVVNGRIQFLHRTVRDFLATSDMYNMLYSRAGASFMPVISLSKVSLAMVKTCHNGSKEGLSTLLLYERRTARKIWPLHVMFLESLASFVLYWLRITYKSEVLRQSDQTCGHMFLGPPEESRSFLDVSNTQDCLVSVKDDLSTEYGIAGHSIDILASPVTGFCWTGVKSAAPSHRMALVQVHDVYAFVARFRDDEDGLAERQRAFVRITQAIFAQPGAFDDSEEKFAYLQTLNKHTYT